MFIWQRQGFAQATSRYQWVWHGSYDQGKLGNFTKSGKVREKSDAWGISGNLKVSECKS